MGKKILLEYTNIVVSIVAGIFFLRETSSCQCLLKWVFCTDMPLDLSAVDGKEAFLRELLLRLGLLLLALSLSVMGIRVVTAKSSPASEEDPMAIKLLNRVMGNTIEQSFFFVGIYVYFLYHKAGRVDKI